MSSRLPLLPVQRLATTSSFLLPHHPHPWGTPIPRCDAKIGETVFKTLCVCVCRQNFDRLLKFIKRKLIRLRSKTHLSDDDHFFHFLYSYRFALLDSSRGSFISLGKILKSFKETVRERVLLDALQRSIPCYRYDESY